MADVDAPRYPSDCCSPRKRTSQSGTRSHPDSVISEHATPPASPERTAEYWDSCVEKLEEKRRLRRAAAAATSPEGKPLSSRQTNRMVLDIISSYGDVDSPYSPSSTSPRAPPSFDFGFRHERDRADSAHDIETIAQALELFPQPLASAKNRSKANARSSSSIKVQGLRKEGQTLASPVPAVRTPPEHQSEPNAAITSRKPRKCPPRPPRPDEAFIIGLPLTPSPHPNRVVRKPIAQQERRSAAPPNIKIIPTDHTPPMSSKSTPALPNLAPQPHIQCPEPTPPATPVRDATVALQQQLISVWEDDDDDDDDDKKGLMEYVRRTLHASKNSFSGDRDRESKEREREREKEREKEKEKRKESVDSVRSTDRLPAGSRRRRDTVRQAVIRAFGCGKGTEQRS